MKNPVLILILLLAFFFGCITTDPNHPGSRSDRNPTKKKSERIEPADAIVAMLLKEEKSLSPQVNAAMQHRNTVVQTCLQYEMLYGKKYDGQKKKFRSYRTASIIVGLIGTTAPVLNLNIFDIGEEVIPALSAAVGAAIASLIATEDLVEETSGYRKCRLDARDKIADIAVKWSGPALEVMFGDADSVSSDSLQPRWGRFLESMIIEDRPEGCQ